MRPAVANPLSPLESHAQGAITSSPRWEGASAVKHVQHNNTSQMECRLVGSSSPVWYGRPGRGSLFRCVVDGTSRGVSRPERHPHPQLDRLVCSVPHGEMTHPRSTICVKGRPRALKPHSRRSCPCLLTCTCCRFAESASAGRGPSTPAAAARPQTWRQRLEHCGFALDHGHRCVISYALDQQPMTGFSPTQHPSTAETGILCSEVVEAVTYHAGVDARGRFTTLHHSRQCQGHRMRAAPRWRHRSATGSTSRC